MHIEDFYVLCLAYYMNLAGQVPTCMPSSPLGIYKPLMIGMNLIAKKCIT